MHNPQAEVREAGVAWPASGRDSLKQALPRREIDLCMSRYHRGRTRVQCSMDVREGEIVTLTLGASAGDLVTAGLL